MTQEVLKDCKECVILGIKSPCSYLVAELEDKESDEKESNWPSRVLANDVKKFGNAKQIRIGKIVAVKGANGLHRGRIDDIYNRNGETKYLILLIDLKRTIETVGKNIYLLKDKKLRDEKAHAFEISLYGIQPATLDINPVSNEIFHYRKCNNWSPAAFKFVKNLFANNRIVFVRIINCDENISGEIYYEDESCLKPVPLSQKLCNEGFAVFCDPTEQSSKSYSHSDYCIKGIEDKIPENALSDEFDFHKDLMEFCIPKQSEKTIMTSEPASSQELSCESFSSSTGDTVFENINSRLSFFTSSDSDTEKWSGSASKSHSPNTPSQGDSNNSVKYVKLNVCRMVLRNLKIFNEKKDFSGAQT